MKHNAKRVVVITGASAGIGRAVARQLARDEGARIGLVARGTEGLEAARSEIVQLGGEALVLPADVADAARLDSIADEVENTFGPIDVWINNAMVSVFAPFTDIKPDEFKRVTEVTYLGAVYGTMVAVKRMSARNEGVIVQVGSALAYRSIPLQSAYCGAKHAIVGFTEAVRSELMHEKSKIRISMVHLPAINTPQFDWSKSRLPNRVRPMPPVFQPELAAEAIVRATRHPRREVYVGSPTVAAIWGNRISPRLMDRYMARSGYKSQQSGDPDDSSRPDNLWRPVQGDHGAHGSFDNEARRGGFGVWASSHLGLITALAASGAAAAALGGKRMVETNGRPVRRSLIHRKRRRSLLKLGRA